MADDLDDEWWQKSSDAEISENESEGGDSDAPPIQKQSLKRQASSPSSDSEDEQPDTEATPPSKKAKIEKNSKSKKKKKKRPSRRKITEEKEANLLKAGTPADVLLLMRTGSSGANSSDDDSLPLNPDTDFFPSNRRLVACKYLSQVLPRWQKTVKKSQLPPGSPLLLVLTSSAIRAVQLKRDIKDFVGKESKTAKLFAKHMKLEEQKKTLQKKVCHVGIGTPNRVQALLEAGSLKLDQLQTLVLDWNWRDVKLKRMVDIPDVKRDLTQLLKNFVVDNVRNTRSKIAIF